MDAIREIHNFSWCKPDWCYPSMSKETNELIKECVNVSKSVPNVDIQDVIMKSKQFPVTFPIETVRLHKLQEHRAKDSLKSNIISTYPLVHERVLLLITHFLIYKCEFGTSIEKALYKDMAVIDFVNRLLRKRAVTFMARNDKYLLLTGENDEDGWESVGTLQQKAPLTLDKVLSYDEMKISSMLYVSGHTEIINNGRRDNLGVVENEGSQKNGVIIGLIGPRFERKGRMEYEDILITQEQNNLENGYGEEVTPTTCLNVLKTTYVCNNQSTKHSWRQIWSEFYQVPSNTHEELNSYLCIQEKSDPKDKYTERYIKVQNAIFDNEVYYKRLSISLECALHEANYRASCNNKRAYLYVVGIGLGVWKYSSHQTDVFVLTILERIKSLLKGDVLNNVSDVNLAYIKPSDTVKELFKSAWKSNRKMFLESKKHPSGGIIVHLSKRLPSEELIGEDEGKLLVMTYPWDGNAHPGNEFWIGSLQGSGDPAAACSTQISELHNAHINPYVTAENMKIVTKNGLVDIQDYCLKT